MNIGVFDSGIGGLTVLKEFIKVLPNYTYIYLGDNKNAPYGEKRMDEIHALTVEGLKFLFAKDCSIVVLACNTASTVLPKIQQEWLPSNYPNRKVLGIIRPTAEHMINSRGEKILMMATPATVASNSYERELKKLGCNKKIFSVACANLAHEIEKTKGQMTERLNDLLIRYANYIPSNNSDDELYLACTHYELVRQNIAYLTKKLPISQNRICADSFVKYIHKHLNKLSLIQEKHLAIYSSRDQSIFEEFAHDYLATKK
jgi:glutamate racemase